MRPRAAHKVGLRRGVLGLRPNHRGSVATDQQEEEEQEQQREQADPEGVPVVHVDASAQAAVDPTLFTGSGVPRVGTAAGFLRVRIAVVVVVLVRSQVSDVAVRHLVGQTVVVGVAEDRHREHEGRAVGRVVGPDGDVQRSGGSRWRAADASVEVGVARRAPAEGQPFGQVAFKLPGRDVTAAVDDRQEGIHRRVLEEVEVLRRVLHRERQVEVRVERITDSVAVRVHRYAGSVGRTRSATSEFVGIRPTVVVVVEVLHQRWNARGRNAGHEGVGHAVTVGVHRAGRVEREGVRAANAAAVGGRLWSVADAVTVAVRVAWAGAVRQTGLVVVEDAVAVHVVVHQVADAVAVHVVRQARCVE